MIPFPVFDPEFDTLPMFPAAAPVAPAPKVPSGPAVCTRCGLVNEYAEPKDYVCYECRQ